MFVANFDLQELWEALQQARGELRHCQEKQQSWEKEGERREGIQLSY